METSNRVRAMEMIGMEREEQRERYTDEDDDKHDKGQLAMAAAAYLIVPTVPPGKVQIFTDELWPWHKGQFNPSPDNRIADLVKAAAFMVAEIERLLRKEKREHEERQASFKTRQAAGLWKWEMFIGTHVILQSPGTFGSQQEAADDAIKVRTKIAAASVDDIPF